jgi:protoporphyrinogen oxidase
MSLPFSDMGAPVVIAGAGLAGLTAGYSLGAAGRDYLILEAADRPGGLCRTETVDGFTFDYTGHLLHLRDGESRDFILKLIGEQLVELARSASIYVEGTFVDYPIQAHFNQLPLPYADRCLEELKKVAADEITRDMSFDQWAVKRFGPTLAGLFMIPYNAKLYVHPLEEMEISWTSWAVPVPTLEELDSIARGKDAPAYGYNTSFFYPREGGIEILPRALSHGQEGSIHTDTRIVRVDAPARKVTLQNGDEHLYSTLISTMPLPELLKITDGLDGVPPGAAGKLRHSSVLGVCLGLTGPVLTGDHWIYFPDPELPFYRVGFPTNFSDRVAPAGCGSLYAEAAFSGMSPPDPGTIADKVVETLAAAGLIDTSAEIASRLELVMPCAYVFHDAYRAGQLDVLLRSLARHNILSVGRYGAWEYSAMQDAVQWGLSAAREVLR